MGHTRLGPLPATRSWMEVINLIAAGSDAPQIATATMNAAERGLHLAADHRGMVETVWLLTQLPLAAREPDFAEALRKRGLDVPVDPGAMDVVAAVSEAIDARMPNNNGRTDLGEMAQAAATELILETVTERTRGLFASTHQDVRDAFARLGTVKQFGEFARHFYGRLTDKVLQYYVSRTTAEQVGASSIDAAGGRRRWACDRNRALAAKFTSDLLIVWIAGGKRRLSIVERFLRPSIVTRIDSG